MSDVHAHNPQSAINDHKWCTVCYVVMFWEGRKEGRKDI